MTNILVADQDEIIRRIIISSLQHSGYKFFQAEDGNKVLESVQKNSIHTIVADWELPEKDGMELLQEIKKIHPQLPVVLMLEMGEQDSKELLDAGAFSVVVKPFNIAERSHPRSHACVTAAWERGLA